MVYNPGKSFISNHLERLNCIIDEYSKMCQNFLFLGDFNATTNEKYMEEFCNLNGFTSFIKKTCFKNPDKPTCIDLTLTNQPNCFQHSNVFETRLSHFHLLTITEFKMGYQKLPPKTVNYRDYRDYKNFDIEKLRPDISKFDFGASAGFKSTIFSILNKHVPIKRKYIREKEAPLISKELHKAIVHRSKLGTVFLINMSLLKENIFVKRKLH